ncbi:hypothetical protein STEG23_020442, partial [Scotinomys teguina]
FRVHSYTKDDAWCCEGVLARRGVTKFQLCPVPWADNQPKWKSLLLVWVSICDARMIQAGISPVYLENGIGLRGLLDMHTMPLQQLARESMLIGKI